MIIIHLLMTVHQWLNETKDNHQVIMLVLQCRVFRGECEPFIMSSSCPHPVSQIVMIPDENDGELEPQLICGYSDPPSALNHSVLNKRRELWIINLLIWTLSPPAQSKGQQNVLQLFQCAEQKWTSVDLNIFSLSACADVVFTGIAGAVTFTVIY